MTFRTKADVAPTCVPKTSCNPSVDFALVLSRASGLRKSTGKKEVRDGMQQASAMQTHHPRSFSRSHTSGQPYRVTVNLPETLKEQACSKSSALTDDFNWPKKR